ncbi:hypothetical protein [Alteribacter populi]|uniref:hypothetical protein n=1 Tax=Alteribacter populi TaxID=2011011 RepID=UPI000BBAE190|nr:hypothetical protein [Alteribacter populi]
MFTKLRLLEWLGFIIGVVGILGYSTIISGASPNTGMTILFIALAIGGFITTLSAFLMRRSRETKGKQ